MRGGITLENEIAKCLYTHGGSGGQKKGRAQKANMRRKAVQTLEWGEEVDKRMITKWPKHMTVRESWQVKWGPELLSLDNIPSWSCTMVFVFWCGNPKWPFRRNIWWWARRKQVNDPVKTVMCDLKCLFVPFYLRIRGVLGQISTCTTWYKDQENYR